MDADARGPAGPLINVAEQVISVPGPMINVFDYEAQSRERLTRMASEYIASGAGDEITLRRNRECFDRMLLQPRVLVDVSRLDTSVELYGEKLEFPVLLAPCAYQKLFHEEGEMEAARGAAATGAPYVVSTFASTAAERIAEVPDASLWFQLYVHPDHGFTEELIQRVEQSGYRALCVTVDTPMLGIRDREKRAGFHLPEGIERENLKPLGTGATKAGHFDKGKKYSILDPAITWKTIEWIRSRTKMPVLLKGVLSAEDAARAAAEGIEGLIVSNHGARNLDTVPATIEALPRITDAVEGRMPVLLDGGIRRGTDVLKALACGARAVLIGRPYLWGLAVGGAAGIQHVMEMLRAEMRAAMMLCGTTSLGEIDQKVLWAKDAPARQGRREPRA